MTREEYIEQLEGVHPTVETAIQALCQAEEISWETARTELLALSREMGFMPTAPQVRDRLLRNFGYVRQTDISRQMASYVQRYMDEHCQRPGVRAIVRVDSGRGGFMLPLLPFPDPENGPTAVRYEYWGDVPFDRLRLRLADIYIRTDGGCAPAGRRSGGRRKEAVPPPEETERFHYENFNPVRVTGDCVVRAIAAAAGLSWNEAFDGLAECAGPDGLILDRYDVYDRYLRRLGFELRGELREENRRLTGAQFCSALDGLFTRGERVVTLLGRSHIAAVLPFGTPQGVRYKIVDTWNSSGKITRGGFWVLDPSAAGGQRQE